MDTRRDTCSFFFSQPSKKGYKCPFLVKKKKDNKKILKTTILCLGHCFFRVVPLLKKKERGKEKANKTF